MGEADRDPELTWVLSSRTWPSHWPNVGESATEVDGDVEDRAADAADELALAGVGLEVQAAQRAALGRARVVLLDEVAVDAELTPALLTKLSSTKPRSSPKTFGSIATRPSMAVSIDGRH